MSSHHIVRENQEPALLVEDFAALSEEYLGQLLEWSPTIITSLENLDYFLTRDIKVDILYGVEKISEAQEEIKYLPRSEEHTSELQSRENLVCRLLLEKKKNKLSQTLLI